MQLALSLGKSKNEDQEEEVLLFVCFYNITKYGSCDTLFHQLRLMQDRALVLEELGRPSYLSSTF